MMFDALLVVGTAVALVGAVALIWISVRDERTVREHRYRSALIDIATDPRCASRDEMVERAIDALRRDASREANDRSRQPAHAEAVATFPSSEP